jgi:hypothetical protein
MKDSIEWRVDVQATDVESTLTNRIKATLNKKLF